MWMKPSGTALFFLRNIAVPKQLTLVLCSVPVPNPMFFCASRFCYYLYGFDPSFNKPKKKKKTWIYPADFNLIKVINKKFFKK